MIPERRQTRFCKGDKCGWQKMHECCRDEYTGTEMTREKQEMVGHRETREAANYDGKRTSWCLVRDGLRTGQEG